jgi:hypothetical protein
MKASIARKGDEAGWQGADAARWHPWMRALFLAVVALEICRAWLGVADPAPAFPALCRLWSTAALTLGVGLARRLPGQNVAAVAAVAGLSGAALEWMNAAVGLPFGPRRLAGEFAAYPAAGVAVSAAAWFSLVLMCRGVARLALRGARKVPGYGLWVLALAALLAAVVMTLADGAAQLDGLWRWDAGRAPAWRTIPWAAPCAWFAILLLVLAFSAPWLLNKRPVVQPTDWHPLVVWMGIATEVAARYAFVGAAEASAGTAVFGIAVCAAAVGFGRVRTTTTPQPTAPAGGS